jgi:hypothetical protein
VVNLDHPGLVVHEVLVENRVEIVKEVPRDRIVICTVEKIVEVPVIHYLPQVLITLTNHFPLISDLPFYSVKGRLKLSEVWCLSCGVCVIMSYTRMYEVCLGV